MDEKSSVRNLHISEECEIASTAKLYLDLMKLVLTDSIYFDDPLAWFVPYKAKPRTPRVKRAVISALQHFLARYRLRLVEPYRLSGFDYSMAPKESLEAMRERGTYWPVRAHTMIGLKRLDHLQHCCESVIRENISGDFIETGVWRGGACIFMRAILEAYGEKQRVVWVADSFEGLPPPDPDYYPVDAGDKLHSYSQWLAVSKEQVERNFRRYRLLDQQIRILDGWFKNTLPNAPIKQLAILRLDGDMYESTIQALDALYSKLSIGGFVIIDDYFFKPCAQAIHDFRQAHGIYEDIIDIDKDQRGSYWRRCV